ncbi:aspartate/glutamate racemase family protein [Kribbella sp. CA-253562]|uniref:aspartate/glutamate racemase family protein n=1 Tax=Kribbella sp. CA-253562 TaxID=3239942 RepID=UPI003D948649
MTAQLKVGLLHTVPALAGTFQDLVARQNPALRQVHVADAELLATAVREGVTEEVFARVRRHVRYLVEDGAAAVLVTCSSIGEAVEAAARDAEVPVLRVDAPMAEEAVRAAGDGGRIAVLATLQATLGPTGRLLERAAAGTGVTVAATVVEGAADARAAGDQDEHDRLVRAAVETAEADAIVLAQASMAQAVAGLDVRTFTSPAGGVAALLAAVGRS